MRRWLQWQTLVPRLLMIGVLLLAAQYGLGVVIRLVVIRSGSAALGGKIAVDHARVSLGDRRIVLSGVRIADANASSRSLLRAERCEFKYAARPLLHKQLVIESGRVDGLQIDAFDELITSSRHATSLPTANCPTGDADVSARKWLEKLNQRLSLDVVNQFASVTRTEQYCEHWQKQSAALDQRLDELETQAAEIEESVAAAEANPLRNDKQLDELRQKASDVQHEFTKLRIELDNLPDQLEAERRAIIAARRQDEEFVGKQLKLEPAEARSLSAYLLRNETANQLEGLISCLRSIRAAETANACFTKQPSRGKDVLFAGCRPTPDLLVRSLQLSGAARIGGQPVTLTGMLSNLSSEPKLQSGPTQLHLVGNGSLPFELKLTTDRSKAVPQDELLLDCQGIVMHRVVLGNDDQLVVQIAPSVGTLSVSIVLNGDRLNGEIQVVQQKASLVPALRGTSGTVLTSSVGETLGNVHSIATRVSVSGTLDKPKCELWSNLGAAVAEAIQRALRKTSDQHARSLFAEAGRRVDERLAEVDRQMMELQTRFSSETSEMTARLQTIATSEAPRYRISEHGGRRLPMNSLFR